MESPHSLQVRYGLPYICIRCFITIVAIITTEDNFSDVDTDPNSACAVGQHQRTGTYENEKI